MSKPADIEASPAEQVERIDTIADLDRLGEKEGYVLDAAQWEREHHGRHLKTATDGHTVLIPQPSDDPNDPLNWSQTKKNVILFVVSLTALLPDYGSAVGAVTLLPQSAIWHMSQDNVNHSQVGNVFMLGAGGLFVTVFGAYFGKFLWHATGTINESGIDIQRH